MEEKTMTIELASIQTHCERIPGYRDATAYVRTKHCCRILTELGESIPNWMTLREIIGKGSSTDINRGIRDFRKEHGEALRKMGGMMLAIPDAFTPHVLGLWDAALQMVQSQYDEKTQEWERQIEQADSRAEQAEQDYADTKAVNERLQTRISGLEENIQSLNNQVAGERAGREQAERLFAAHSAEVQSQRERLEATLETTQSELRGALERLEGVQRHSLVQIDEARTRANNEIARMRAQFDREKSDLELLIANLKKTMAELREQKSESDQRRTGAEQELSGLRERLQRAEAQSDHLASENARLVSALQDTVATKRSSLRGKSVSIKKRQTHRIRP